MPYAGFVSYWKNKGKSVECLILFWFDLVCRSLIFKGHQLLHEVDHSLILTATHLLTYDIIRKGFQAAIEDFSCSVQILMLASGPSILRLHQNSWWTSQSGGAG